MVRSLETEPNLIFMSLRSTKRSRPLRRSLRGPLILAIIYTAAHCVFLPLEARDKTAKLLGVVWGNSYIETITSVTFFVFCFMAFFALQRLKSIWHDSVTNIPIAIVLASWSVNAFIPFILSPSLYLAIWTATASTSVSIVKRDAIFTGMIFISSFWFLFSSLSAAILR